jgi:hypothetical protein
MRGNGFMQRRFGRRLESGESVVIVSEFKFYFAWESVAKQNGLKTEQLGTFPSQPPSGSAP